MLVLTRKTDECIRIGDNITIKVVRVRGNTVRIGIEAPTEVSVRRGELGPKTIVAAAGTVPHIVGDRVDAGAELALYST